MGRHLVVPRASQRDRHPLALMSALSYLGGEAAVESVAAYWAVTTRTVRRWAQRAESRGWVSLCSGRVIRSESRGQEAWRTAFKERVGAHLRGKMPLARLALWGRLSRRRAFGTRLMAQDVRCDRRTVQRALRTGWFGTNWTALQGRGRCATPFRWARDVIGQNAAPPKPSPKKPSTRALRSPGNDRPEAPLGGALASFAEVLTGLGLVARGNVTNHDT
jgi:hypothetical protein